MKNIAVIGLGYVGLPLAVEFGKIRKVIGFDISRQRIADLRKGFDATKECSIDEIKSAEYLDFSNEVKDIEDAKIYIVTVPTPIDKNNKPDLDPLTEACSMVGSVLKYGDTVIFESTVFPGATEDVCVPILEGESGLKFNIDFYCGYSPERINPGDKINSLTTIAKITSGSTKIVAEEVNDLYLSIIGAGTWKASSIMVAEAAKVIENSQRDLNIAFVNELSIIFDRLGLDTLEVLEAAGSKWNFLPFRPGLVGGHCIGVDPFYLTYKAEQVGYYPHIILAGRRVNDGMASYAAQSIIKKMLKNGVDVARSSVGVLGITFKENCPDIRNSKVVDLIKELENWNVDVKVQDPVADPEEVKNYYGISLTSIDPENKVDALVVAVGHDQYRALSPETLKSYCNISDKIILGDLKSLYVKSELVNLGFDLFRL